MRRIVVIVLLAACVAKRQDGRAEEPAAQPERPAAATDPATAPTTNDAGASGATGQAGESGSTGPTTMAGPFVIAKIEVTGPTTIDVSVSHPVRPASVKQSGVKLDGVPLVSLSLPSPQTLRVRTHDFLAVAATLDLFGIEDAAGTPLADATGHVVQGIVPAQTSPFVAVDDPGASEEGPGAWTIAGAHVQQTSNVYGGSASDRLSLDKPGTYYLTTAVQNDALVQATLTNPDDDGMGLIARYTDATHYYRFEWLSQGSQRRLVKINGSEKKVLDLDVAPFVPGQSYRVRLAVVGARLSVFIDDVLVLQAADAALSQGRFGVYCWGSQGLTVDDLVVGPASAPSYPEWATRLHTAAPIFTHAPMVSEIDAQSALVWARTSEPADVRVLVSTVPEMTAPVASAVVATQDATDRTARVALTGLSAGTRYYLQVEARDKAKPGERNLTAPRQFTTAGTSAIDLSLVWFGDVHDGAEARFKGFDAMAAAQPDFALALGDFPYADGDPGATTLAEYRTKHAVVRSIPALDGFIARFPIYGVWDDHEIANDWDGATSASRVQNGVKAWHEWWAVKPHASAPPSAIYRSVRYGSTLEIFLLDTRSQRPANSLAQSPTKSMLGAAQKAWLLQALAASTARFKLIVTSVPLRYGTTGNDHWEGYKDERKQILDAALATTGVFFITADQHWHAAHAHPEGLFEFQASSLSAGLRTPLSPKPAEVVYESMQHGYGRIQVKGTGADPHVTVSLHDLDGMTLYTKDLRP